MADQEKGPDIVSDHDKEVAQNALAEFKKKNYTACFQLINKLEDRSGDLKVVQNRAIVEFLKNDLKKTEIVQKNLTQICNQFQIKAEKLDYIDYCIILYNLTVLLFHQKRYTDAQRIMDKVYKFIEPMDENLAKQVSLLAIELQLSIRKPDKALKLISYLENNLIYGGSLPLKGLDKNGKDRKITLPPPKPLSEEFERKLLKYKVRCYVMNHSMKTAIKEIPVLLKDKSNIDAMFLSANIEYIKGNYEGAVQILTSIPNGCLNYHDCGESSTIMFYNNMGAIHYAMGKPNLACHYFQMALKEDIKLMQQYQKKDDSDKPLYTLGGSKYHELMYNLGIALLHSKRPTQAFDCLIIAVRRYHRNSRLWMRLAECCIMVHKETNEVDFGEQKNLIAELIGSAEKQKVVLATNFSNDKKYSTESQSYAVPVPSLEFASLCLRNAYLLIPSDTETPPVPLFLVTGIPPPAPPPSPGPSPSCPLNPDGIAVLRNGILIASAYVSLCLGDYILALEYSKELLDQPRISEVHKLLAHLYAAESLVLLDKISEALEHLKPENIKDISFDLPQEESEDDIVKNNPPPKWFPDNIQTAYSVMQYNIAVAKTMRGQLDQAGILLRQIWQMKKTCKVPAHIVMLYIYIELQLGHMDAAKTLIRQYQHRLTG
ncbi:CCR4-NOT transcription complex subunit 10 [Diabrotica virgifera virgifera]|uniref:CCR4-NOT transcription complex subunit 10 n=1 Tax=Diabrotica virgifera virgifera TaxID=50390 RepID=A0ABM5IU28_DIAVI|nr:CCR4-NOT transcription complex subunit 10 [Diabrotica virgifera virgifera]